MVVAGTHVARRFSIYSINNYQTRTCIKNTYGARVREKRFSKRFPIVLIFFLQYTTRASYSADCFLFPPPTGPRCVEFLG